MCKTDAPPARLSRTEWQTVDLKGTPKCTHSEAKPCPLLKLSLSTLPPLSSGMESFRACNHPSLMSHNDSLLAMVVPCIDEHLNRSTHYRCFHNTWRSTLITKNKNKSRNKIKWYIMLNTHSNPFGPENPIRPKSSVHCSSWPKLKSVILDESVIAIGWPMETWTLLVCFYRHLVCYNYV